MVEGEDDLADGRLILLHDPAGHEAWHGTFRLVTLVRAELEPEMAADPLLRGVLVLADGGTGGARAGVRGGERHRDHGGLALLRRARGAASGDADRDQASWTPREGAGGVPDTPAHLSAWCELICQIAGLPPVGPTDTATGVVSLPQRRGPHHP